MNSRALVLGLAAVALAVVLRMPTLRQRPMHCDEAVHAVKFGQLSDEGRYEYDPFEYHGPTLNFFSLIPAWLTSTDSILEINEAHLRAVPALFGILIVLITFGLRKGIGLFAVAVAAMLAAISPAMSFYSRYYIQEMLLVCFTFAAIVCGWRYIRQRRLIWAIGFGASLGLMHATKETCIIAVGCAFLAYLVTFVTIHPPRKFYHEHFRRLNWWHVAVMIFAAAFVSVTFFSSFYTYRQGVPDSVHTYTTYFNRAHAGSVHIHPWHYYLHMLAFWRLGNGPIWTEGIVIVLATVACVLAFRRKGIAGMDTGLVRFLAFYTLLMAVVYSLIPYKTPWSILSAYHGMILLAGIGTAAIAKALRNPMVRSAVLAVITIACIHLACQAFLANTTFASSPANPYVYSHPTEDVYQMVAAVEKVGAAEGIDVNIHVVAPESDYWPLPWYLRKYPNIGWFDEVDFHVVNAPVVIVDARLKDAMTRKLYQTPPPGQKELYVPLFDEPLYLRPGQEMVGMITNSLYNRLEQAE